MGRGRGTVKIKKVMPKGTQDDTNMLNSMFEQMTGSSNAEPDVILPKIISINTQIIKFNKLFSLLLNLTEFRSSFMEYDNWFVEIQEFLVKLLESTKVDITKKYTDEDYKMYDEKQLNAIYKSLKENKFTKVLVITSSNLSKYKKYIEDPQNLDDSFINREPGLSLQPLTFSNLDLKIMWHSDNITQQSKKYMLSILSHTYKIGVSVYDTITSPDIDIKKFSSVLIKSISQMKKQIPRCDKAFDIIENSVKMLEGNFKDYYKNSVESENPSVIIESFIIDVSVSQKASPLVTAQFRRIVSHLQQKSKNIQDPKVKKLFGMLNGQFSMMDQELGVDTSKDVESDLEEKKDD